MGRGVVATGTSVGLSTQSNARKKNQRAPFFLSMASTTTHLDCFFDQEEAKQYVLTTGHSHPWGGKVLYKNGNGITETPVLNASAYMSAGSVDRTCLTIDACGEIQKFKSRFPFMATYSMEMILPGQSGTFMATKDAPMFIIGAELKPTFFDAKACTSDGHIHYNQLVNARVPGLRHSGDITSSGYFMHSIDCNNFTDGVSAIAAVGYGKTFDPIRSCESIHCHGRPPQQTHDGRAIFFGRSYYREQHTHCAPPV